MNGVIGDFTPAYVATTGQMSGLGQSRSVPTSGPAGAHHPLDLFAGKAQAERTAQWIPEVRLVAVVLGGLACGRTPNIPQNFSLFYEYRERKTSPSPRAQSTTEVRGRRQQPVHRGSAAHRARSGNFRSGGHDGREHSDDRIEHAERIRSDFRRWCSKSPRDFRTAGRWTAGRWTACRRDSQPLHRS